MLARGIYNVITTRETTLRETPLVRRLHCDNSPADFTQLV
jgi:hypothetical protein